MSKISYYIKGQQNVGYICILIINVICVMSAYLIIDQCY